MTPLALLVVFCVAMSAVAIARLALAADRSYVDVGSTFVVVGVALWSGWWVSLEGSWLGPFLRGGLAIAGALSLLIGLTVMWRYWEEATVGAR